VAFCRANFTFHLFKVSVCHFRPFSELYMNEDLSSHTHTHTHTHTHYHVSVRSLEMSQSARVSELVFDPKLRHLLFLKTILCLNRTRRSSRLRVIINLPPDRIVRKFTLVHTHNTAPALHVIILPKELHVRPIDFTSL